MSKPLPSPEMLRKLLRYEPETGKLFWRARTPDMFADGNRTPDHTCRIWNSRLFGEEALSYRTRKGYCSGYISYVKYLAHRVIWAMVHDEWPDGEIDHINGVKDDNRLINLRSVTHSENGRNQKKPHTNTSGFIGVSWDKASRKWKAYIRVDGVLKHLGLFTELDDAVSIRASAEVNYGYHQNHGR